jgi:transcriptional regulator with XRE-family HTH domain
MHVMVLTTGAQLRAARALVRMEQAQLAEAAGVSVETVRRLERFDGRFNATMNTVRDLTGALETAGVEFKPDGSVRRREAADAEL